MSRYLTVAANLQWVVNEVKVPQVVTLLVPVVCPVFRCQSLFILYFESKVSVALKNSVKFVFVDHSNNDGVVRKQVVIVRRMVMVVGLGEYAPGGRPSMK